jgi:uncharacterized membrane protein
MKIKTMARIGAGLSFAAFFLAGVCLLAISGFRVSGEYFLLTALGLFFVGTAFCAGLMLWLAIEKWSARQPEQASDEHRAAWPRKIMLPAIYILVVVFVALPLVRMVASALAR